MIETALVVGLVACVYSVEFFGVVVGLAIIVDALILIGLAVSTSAAASPVGRSP